MLQDLLRASLAVAAVVAIGPLAGCAGGLPAPIEHRPVGAPRSASSAVRPAPAPVAPAAPSTVAKPAPGMGGPTAPAAALPGTAAAVETAPIRTPSGIDARPLPSAPAAGPQATAPVTMAPSTAGTGSGSVAGATAGGTAVPRSQPRGTKQPFSEAARADLARGDAIASQGLASPGIASSGAASPGSASPGRPADERAPAVRPPQAPPVDPRTAETKAADARPADTAPAEGRAANGAGDPVWGWPADGRVLQGFDESRGKGIAIAGRPGEAVSAAADGKVIFSGVVRGYGNLVIVKHAADLLSVYAHNRALSVREGDSVRRGQKIAEIGDTDADRVKLHFEIRRQGKPVDPARLLPVR